MRCVLFGCIFRESRRYTCSNTYHKQDINWTLYHLFHLLQPRLVCMEASRPCCSLAQLKETAWITTPGHARPCLLFRWDGSVDRPCNWPTRTKTDQFSPNFLSGFPFGGVTAESVIGYGNESANITTASELCIYNYVEDRLA